jgi:molybdopterin-guanine dinucleotide biosynthesis protein
MANERLLMLACFVGQVMVVQVKGCPGVNLAIHTESGTVLLTAAAAPIGTQLEHAAESNDLVIVCGFWVGTLPCRTLNVHQVEPAAAFASRIEASSRAAA